MRFPFRIEEKPMKEEICEAQCLLTETTINLPQKRIESDTPGNDITENVQNDSFNPTDSSDLNLSSLLPSNSYARMSSNSRSYLFYGAEVTLENIDDDDSDSGSDEYSDDIENEESPIPASEDILSLIATDNDEQPQQTLEEAVIVTHSISDKSEIESERNTRSSDAIDEDIGPSSLKKPKLDDATDNSIL